MYYMTAQCSSSMPPSPAPPAAAAAAAAVAAAGGCWASPIACCSNPCSESSTARLWSHCTAAAALSNSSSPSAAAVAAAALSPPLCNTRSRTRRSPPPPPPPEEAWAWLAKAESCAVVSARGAAADQRKGLARAVAVNSLPPLCPASAHIQANRAGPACACVLSSAVERREYAAAPAPAARAVAATFVPMTGRVTSARPPPIIALVLRPFAFRSLATTSSLCARAT